MRVAAVRVMVERVAELLRPLSRSLSGVSSTAKSSEMFNTGRAHSGRFGRVNPLSFVLGLSVTNLDRSIAWYRQVFGLGGIDLQPVEGIVEFQYGPIWLQLVQADTTPAGAKVVANFQVADVNAERDRLADLDVLVGSLVHVPNAVDYFEFTDPDGNALILHSLNSDPQTDKSVGTASDPQQAEASDSERQVAAPPPPTVWPTLAARDALALIDFLEGAFGFRRGAVFADSDGFVHHAELSWPDGGGVMLGSEKPEGRWQQSPGVFGAYVVCNDTDTVYERARSFGAVITSELSTSDFGSREFIAQDPEGNMWSFGTYRGEPV